MNPIVEVAYFLVMLGVFLIPSAVVFVLIRWSIPVSRSHRRRSPKAKALSAPQMSKVNAAVASVLTAGEPSGNIYSLFCAACGSERAQPAERAQLWPGEVGGWQILMQCSCCDAVLVSRLLTRPDAELAADMNVQLITDLARVL